MPITGRLTTAGRLFLVPIPDASSPVETIDGVVLEMEYDDIRAAAARFLNQRVAIWTADELVPRAGSPAMEPTHENMQHLAMRNEAATRVRVDLEARLKEALQDFREQQTACMQAVEANMGLSAEVDRLAAELAAALSEVNKLRRASDDRALVSDAERSLNEISEAMDD